MSFTPQASAEPHSPALMHIAAMWRATREELQAVSTERHGPLSPKVKLRRPAATEMAEPTSGVGMSDVQGAIWEVSMEGVMSHRRSVSRGGGISTN